MLVDPDEVRRLFINQADANGNFDKPIQIAGNYSLASPNIAKMKRSLPRRCPENYLDQQRARDEDLIRQLVHMPRIDRTAVSRAFEMREGFRAFNTRRVREHVGLSLGSIT
jgi:hypothetical protein